MNNQLKIIDYFESLIDQVDLRAETLLSRMSSLYDENVYNQELNLDKIINERRNTFIEEIQKVKIHNLQSIGKNTDDERIFDKYCFILDKCDLEVQRAYLNPANNSHVSSMAQINRKFGYLIVLEDGRICQRNLDFLREMFLYCDIVEENLDDLTRKKQIQQFYQDQFDENEDIAIESNIFDAKLHQLHVRFFEISNVVNRNTKKNYYFNRKILNTITVF